MSKTRSILKRFALLREYKVLSDVTVSVDGTEHHFDHLLIGCFGILSLCSFSKKGELYGNDRDDVFILLNGNKTKRTKTENLIKKAQNDEMVLRKLLSQAKIYKIKIDTGIVIESKLCNAMIPSATVPVYTPQTLKKQLNCGKYDMDHNVNVSGILDVIAQSK